MLTIQFQVENKEYTTGMAEKRGDLTGFDGIQGSHTAKRLKDCPNISYLSISSCSVSETPCSIREKEIRSLSTPS